MLAVAARSSPTKQGENIAIPGAEGVGFEPTNTFVLPVFKTGSFSLSLTPPTFFPIDDSTAAFNSLLAKWLYVPKVKSGVECRASC